MNIAPGGIAPPPHSLDQQWYIVKGGQAAGPFPGSKLVEMIRSGELLPTSHVCPVGGKDWLAASSVPFLANAFEQKSPPPEAPPINVQGEQRYRPGNWPAAAVPAGNVRYAGFWIRVVAGLIDGILVYALSFAVGLAIGLLFRNTGVDVGPFASLAGVATVIAYQVLTVGGEKQATWGKQLMGLKVVRVDGQKIGGGLAVGRYLAYIISFITLYIGFIMVAFTDQKKGLHDMICGTRVVYRD